jgi:hypothetical protein
MSDFQSVPDTYLWTGGAGIIGRLMYHAREVERGKRKVISWLLVTDIFIAFAMGWGAAGVCDQLNWGMKATISAAIFGAYLGPFSLDLIFTRWAEKFFGGKS